MSIEVVDTIVAELILRIDNYERNANRLVDLHRGMIGSITGMAAEQEKYSAKHTQSLTKINASEDASAAKITRARKSRADAAVASDEREVASAKKAAREKADAEIAAQQRISAMVERSIANNQRRTGSGRNFGALVPREQTGQRSISSAVLNGPAAAEVAAETEINHLMLDRFDLAAKAAVAEGAVKRELKDEVDYLRRIDVYKRAGLSETQAAVRAEAELAAVEKLRTDTARRKDLQGVGRFAEGAGIGRFGGSGAAVAGLALAAITAATVKAVDSGLEYAHSLATISSQLGVSTRDLQVWEQAAASVGVTTEQLRDSLGQLSTNLGKAQEGGQQQGKIFAALNIDIGNAKDGYKTLSEILPTFLDRLSKISNQQQRFAIETALGGEQLRKLDPILSKGSGSFDELAKSIEATGTVLGDKQIQDAANTANKLRALGDQLQRKLAGVVAENASAIELLATAFFNAASGALKLVSAITQLSDKKVRNSPYLFGSSTDMRVAEDRQNSTPQGRADNRETINSAISTLRNARRLPSGVQIFVPGVGYIDNTSAARVGAIKDVLEQSRRLRAAENSDKQDVAAPPQAGGPGDLSNVFAPKPPKGPRGKSADTIKREADAREQRFIDTMARYYDEQQSAVAEQTTDEYERLRLSKEQIERDRDRAYKDLELKADEDIRNGADKKITQARLAQEKEAAKAAAAEKLNVVSRDAALEGIKRDYDAESKRLDIAEDDLRTLADIATTNAERKRIALALLEIDRQRESLNANNTITRYNNDDTTVSTSGRNAAQKTLDTQGQRFAARTKATNQQYLSPFEAYRKQLRDTADATNDALETIAVNGLGQLEDQLASTIGHVLGLKGAFGDLVASVLTDLAKLDVERAFLKIFGGGGGSDVNSKGGGIFGTIVRLLGGGGSSKGALGALTAAAKGARAGGGPVSPGRWLVGERGPEIVDLGASGRVYPNGQLPPAMGGGGALTLQQHIHVDGRNSVTPAKFAEQIIGVANAHANKVAAQAGRTAVEASPARATRLGTLGS